MTDAAPISFRVLGHPKPQPKPHAWFNKKLGRAGVFDPKSANGWKGSVAIAAEPKRPPAPMTGAADVTIHFYFARPRGHFGTGRNALTLKPSAPAWPMQHYAGDVDNLAKAVMDCLTTLAFWHDDAQVVRLHVMKLWANDVEPPGAYVIVEEAR